MSKNPRKAQALLLAAIFVAATIYTMYALTLTYVQTQGQPSQAEIYAEALSQALADASATQNTTLAQQLYQKYVWEATNQRLIPLQNMGGQPVFQYSGYNQKLCVGCSVSAKAAAGPYSVAISLTLVYQNATTSILRLSYTVDGQEVPLYMPQVHTAVAAQTSWNGENLTVTTKTQTTFTLTLTTQWGLVLTCLL